MRTENGPFQLEKNYPGIFLVQGWLGGFLAAFITLVSICYWNGYWHVWEAIAVLLYLAIPLGIVAVVKATIMWALYRLSGIQLGAAGRAIVSTITVGVLALLTAIKFDFVSADYFIAWMITTMLAGLPTALLVGSTVKPWELFTFGSIGGLGSRSVLGTLGTFPLRFLSFGALPVWIFYFVSEPGNKQWAPSVIFFGLVPVAYLLLSAYLTFRSPDKVTLFVIGVVVNIPVAMIGVFVYKIYLAGAYWLGEAPLYFCVICAAFLIAWGICLVARLSVETRVVAPLSILANDVITRRHHLDHHCLGSRFLEWQERHA